MVRVISLEQAISQGDTPAELLAIADWHEARLAETPKGMRKRDYTSAARHLDTAETLRSVADELAASLERDAA